MLSVVPFKFVIFINYTIKKEKEPESQRAFLEKLYE